MGAFSTRFRYLHNPGILPRTPVEKVHSHTEKCVLLWHLWSQCLWHVRSCLLASSNCCCSTLCLLLTEKSKKYGKGGEFHSQRWATEDSRPHARISGKAATSTDLDRLFLERLATSTPWFCFLGLRTLVFAASPS